VSNSAASRKGFSKVHVT